MPFGLVVIENLLDLGKQAGINCIQAARDVLMYCAF